jgi:hypothetical protein
MRTDLKGTRQGRAPTDKHEDAPRFSDVNTPEKKCTMTAFRVSKQTILTPAFQR